MTNTLSLAALFFVGTVAATASLLHEPAAPGHAATADAGQEVTHRGTRTPLRSVADAEPTVGTQPRRGERTAFERTDNRIAGTTTDGLRRGTRL